MVVCDGDTTRRHVLASPSEIIIGRAETADLRISSISVSRRHARITVRDGEARIADLGSQNGVKVNGTRVHKKVLSPGDTITIAKHTYRIEYTPPVGMHSVDEMLEDVDDTIAQSLLEKAGLARPQRLPQLRNPKEVLGKLKKQPKQEPKEK